MNFNTRGNNNLSHDITIPEGGEKASLVLVITSSRIMNNTLIAFLTDLVYRIAGPFSSVDSAHMFIRGIKPDLVIYDSGMGENELKSFENMLIQDAKDVPVILITNNVSKLNHSKQLSLNFPIDPLVLRSKINRSLFDKDISSSPSFQLLEFTNKLFQKLLLLAPDDARYDIEKGINQAILQFTSRNSDFSKMSDKGFTLRLRNPLNLDPYYFVELLHLTIKDLIKSIDQSRKAQWAKSLVNDSIESILINSNNISEAVVDFVSRMGINATAFQDSLQSVVPKASEEEKIIFVAYMTIADLGPEMLKIVSTNDIIVEGIDDNVAAQIITLVGQGSSYHQGIFGPIPIPTANNICAVIWSKLINSNIKDQRMKGKSLTVVAIGFYRELLTRIPSRDKLENFFSLLDQVTHVDNITENILLHMHDEFIKQLN